MNREKNLLKNTLIIALGTFLPRFTTLVTLPILTAYLTKAEYGTFDLISTLISLILPIATLKIEAAAFRFLIDCRDDEEETRCVISNIYAFLLPISFLVISILFFLNGTMPFLTRGLLCLYFLLDIIFSATQQVIRGLARNMLYSVSAIIYAVINMLMIVLTVACLREGLNGVLCSMSVALFMSLVVLTIPTGLLKKISLHSVSKKKLKVMIQYSWPMIPNSLSSWVMNLSDRLIISLFLGVEANAIYAVANKIPTLFATLQGTFTFAWQENASLAVNDGDTEEYYSAMFDYIFSILVGGLSGLIAVTPVLFEILINEQYSVAYYQMPLLFGGMFFSAMSSFLGGIYVAHKNTKSVGITTILSALLNIIINFTLINKIGIYAASLSTFISYLFLTVYRMIDIQKFQKLKYKNKKNLLCLSVMLIMGIICYLNNFYLNILNFIFGFFFAFITCRKMIIALIKMIFRKIGK